MNMKDAYYFPHFSNARHDRKLKRAMKELGNEAYSIYFMLLEVLREEDGFKYPLSDIDLLIEDFMTTHAKIEAVIKGYGLFQVDTENNFFSENQILFLQPYIQRKNHARNAALIRWGKEPDKVSVKHKNAVALQGDSTGNASKVKESIVEESKIKTDPIFPEYKNSDFKDFNHIFKRLQENFSDHYLLGDIENHFRHQSQIGKMATWGKATIYNKCVKMMLSDEKYKKGENNET
jgi:hypothetical protein